MNETVSVIVPVYNAEKTIERCLNSIINQTYSDIEIIVINDGSMDSSLEKCRRYRDKDKRIILINQENAGVSVARNAGINSSNGDYLMFVDADDSISLDMVNSMVAAEKHSKAQIVMCNYEEVTENESHLFVNQLRITKDTVINSESIIERMISISDNSVGGVCWRVLYQRKLIRENNIQFTSGLTMAEDMQFVLKCLKATTDVALVYEGYYYFSRSNNSTTGKYMNKQEGDMEEANKWLLDYSKNYLENDKIQKGVIICIANTLLANAANLCRKGTPFSFKERIQHLKELCAKELYKTNLLEAMKYKDLIPRKRYLEMFLLSHRMYFIDILYHSKNYGTIRKGNKG